MKKGIFFTILIMLISIFIMPVSVFALEDTSSVKYIDENVKWERWEDSNTSRFNYTSNRKEIEAMIIKPDSAGYDVCGNEFGVKLFIEGKEYFYTDANGSSASSAIIFTYSKDGEDYLRHIVPDYVEKDNLLGTLKSKYDFYKYNSKGENLFKEETIFSLPEYEDSKLKFVHIVEFKNDGIFHHSYVENIGEVEIEDFRIINKIDCFLVREDMYVYYGFVKNEYLMATHNVYPKAWAFYTGKRGIDGSKAYLYTKMWEEAANELKKYNRKEMEKEPESQGMMASPIGDSEIIFDQRPQMLKSGEIRDTSISVNVLVGALIRINYIDELGNTIYESDFIMGNPGEEYTISPKEIPSYEFVNVINGNLDIVFPDEGFELTFEYKKFDTFDIEYKGNGHSFGEAPTDLQSPYRENILAKVLPEDNMKRAGYEFVGWNTNADGSGEQFKPGDEIMMDKNIILYAQWKKVDDVEGEIEEPTDYSSIIWDWGHTTTKPEQVEVDENANIVNSLHRGYLKGYPDGSIKPQGEITRAEVAAIIARLHADVEDIDYVAEAKYADVNANAWYAKYIAYVSNKGLMKGYEDGSFKPEEKITRAEYATVVARFKNLERIATSFEDSKDHWASEFIGAVANKKWITGYPDGSFKPMNNISREEVATMTNKMLDRKVNSDGLVNANTKKFTDLEFGTWSYYDLIEASNTHEYVRRETGSIVEDWKNVID